MHFCVAFHDPVLVKVVRLAVLHEKKGRILAPLCAGHRLRHELLESWAADPLPGSQAGMASLTQTEADMRSAVFCVCPPGAPVWPSRVRQTTRIA